MSEPRPARERVAAVAPGLANLLSYRVRWLGKDVTAGLVLTALLVPQGMAYAELAGLPAITGLYTSILCLVGYALFGPSRVLVLGPDSSLGPLIAATILPLAGADGDPARAIALASALALITGAVMITAGITGLGFVADLISRPAMIGYLNGLALTILVGQLPKLFGFSVDAESFLGDVTGFFSGLGSTVPAALAVGAVGLVLILVLQRFLPKVPAVLVVVVLSIGATALLGLAARGVDVVGPLPQGFPPLSLPDVRLSDLALLVPGALGIAVIALTDTISTSSSFAAREGRTIDGGREMTAIGASNVAAGLFGGFPVSTSGSRTAVAGQAGARTQLTGLVGAAAITLILLFVPGLLRDLPQPTLAAVVIAASLSLTDLPATRRLFRVRRTEFVLSATAALGVIALGVLPGMAVTVALSAANVFRRAWWPYRAVLGRVPGLPGFHDLRSHPHAEQLPGCLLVRHDAPIFFANARTFREWIDRLVARDPEVRWVVVAAEPVTDIDTTAVDMLRELAESLHRNDRHLVFAELKDPVRHDIERAGLTATIDPAHLYPTIDAAVDAFRERTGAQWRSVDG
ncbi:MAG: SulP family inorganic anion transporter [Pseudonocardiaceae bacterium]|nr:MAG: SulP family inorganic anion transporter [Pseudonocardiaceae bacterium]